MSLSKYESSTTPPFQWYAVRVKPNHEQSVACGLAGRGLEEFLPLQRSVRRHSRGSKTVELPLFPGYVFSRFDARDRLPVLTVPGVLHIVSMNHVPAPVDAEEILAIQKVIKSGAVAQAWPFTKAGQLVRVTCGSLQGLEGIILRLKNDYLIVSLTLLQRSVAVEVNRHWVCPIGPPGKVPERAGPVRAGYEGRVNGKGSRAAARGLAAALVGGHLRTTCVNAQTEPRRVR